MQTKSALRTLILGSGIFFVLSHSLYGQKHDLKFEHFSIEDGLSHSKVNCIFQDKRGFLWIGTNDGLNKYDAYEFTVYRWKPNDPQGLSAQLVRAVLQDSKGNLWIGTEGGGINLFDRDSNTFRHFTPDSSSEIKISSEDVNSVIEDRQGNLWLGTGNGLDLFDLQNKKVINYVPPDFTHAPRISRIVNVVYEDRQNNLWVGSLNSGLWLFDRSQQSFTCYQHKPNDPHSLGDNDVRSIHEDSQGNLWIGTTFGGLNLFDRKEKTFRRFFPNGNNAESNTIRAILDDGTGNLWVGNRSGLYHFDTRTHRFTHYQHDPNNPYSLSHNSVQCIFRDAKGDLWIGTRDGLNFINTNISGFTHYQAKAHDRRFLNNKVVYAICEDRQGDLWFGTEEGGLNHLDRKTGLFTYYKHDSENPHSLSVNNIKAILEDRDGNLWIGTFQGGLNFFERHSKRFYHYQNRPHDPTSLAGNQVSVLLLDEEGELWVGTYENGLDVWNPKLRRFIHFFAEFGLPGYRMISALMQDRQGKIWIGSNRGRLGCWDKSKREFKHYQLPIKNIITIEIRPIFEDASGNFWIGTTGGGLYYFNRKDETFKAFTMQDGLPSNIIYGILPDGQRHLWLSTANGLVKFDTQTDASKTYYKENGLQSNQFCYDAFLKSRSGEMFFGGINGVTAFYPGNIHENAYVPPVVITGLKIFNKPVEIAGPDGILKKSITETHAITLSHRHSVFSFEFAALNYAISAQNQYAYKMEGFDKDWNWVGNRRFATYTNLNPGTYTFRVKAANNDGVWNEQGASIIVTITPPFWQTWWFKILGIALLLLIVKHFYDYQVQKRNALQARALANLSQLKLLRYQMNPHFLFNAHNSIRSMILIDKDRAWQMITELSEFFRYTLLNFDKVAASLDEEIKAVDNYLHIEKIRYMDSLKVSFQIDEAARKCSVPAFLFQPVVENAIRYGMQTSPMPLQVVISITLNDGILSIDVSNTGKLIKGADGKKEEAHGTSLENLKQRLELMFKDRYGFQLYEEDGWVHTKIKIKYEPGKNGSKSENKFPGLKTKVALHA
ncbi:MAG: histidine kinase [candidate division KSB1 bacterium]|nr:histidine kinase [candidate division KSB1 bacterium]MDZ7305165.1 histidine kinase [candidate division KSB1 bacterium]MDZ7312936.1 histidine kinase [candidate division KSB1 bacterium]